MFRKLAHMLLAFFILFTTTGVTISMHYCGEKLKSVSFVKEAKSCCNDLGNCCKNKTIHFQLKDDYVSPDIIGISNVTVQEVLFPTIFLFIYDFFSEDSKGFVLISDESPPGKTQTKLSFFQTYLC